MTDALVFDTRALYDASAGGARPASDARCRVEPLAWRSRNVAALREADRDDAANRAFAIPLFAPAEASGPARDLVVVLPGLNEGMTTKLFPWAYNLAARGMSVALFPTAFHLGRRAAGDPAERTAVHQRRAAIDGNRGASPFNAVLSERLDAHAERFLRGARQSYGDLVDLARAVRDGDEPTLARVVAPGGRVHLLGYSISGYLALLALLADPEGLFATSRALLFSTGAAFARIDPVSTLILDSAAHDAVMAFYEREAMRAAESTWLEDVGWSKREAAWLVRMFLGDASFAPLADRVAVVANRADKVFPLAAVESFFAGLPVEALSLAIHELPFAHAGPLAETYASRQGRELLLAIGRSHAIAEPFRDGFARFIDRATELFQRADG